MLQLLSVAVVSFAPSTGLSVCYAQRAELSLHCQEMRDGDDELVAEDPLPTVEQPLGIHLGVICDKTMNPIVGYRYTRKGSNPSFDLCQAEYDKLSESEQQRFERIDPQLTPRRAVFGVAATAALAALGRATLFGPVLTPPTLREDEYDYMELPPLSPAESLVGMIFQPKVPATVREVAPTAPRRVAF